MERNSNKFVGGKLKLKIKKKKIDKKKVSKGKEKETENEETNIVTGSGRVITIKNTIQGFDTNFIEELKVGYEIILEHPTSLQTEKRIVTSILSNKTVLVNEEFTSDFSTTCKFYINKIEKDNKTIHENENDNNNLEYVKVIENKNKHDVIKIRQKVGLWSYKIVDKKIKGNMTNEQKLDERVKSGRDKFCW
ncbi:hypothetical protein PFAG_02105 [Plasmodium falciparum Santa Lucia]|uniref:Uncharacterized protein n=14 Tax=Plasmodium falciparum TaxID=5833 RepID=Q8IB46_PLAF7|nr:conserved protein, unknown function [Plasmodium falciparum 3D7]ETW18948.1 hypothetical protein PFFVO_02155 [Plasmodium falciparum Vietnam Oak-Knoll (FVO)]ETW31103.1 hypothetical protein PFFCH_01443 [Plasmodium falciparum FCH/4]ETW32724.1 hypothetical protein PFTANZ_06557 [Plasmodium falciparum Tanzania (2000708)]ETW43361.1 hypothetical protein PFNF135_02273 [Plasmodium falciparum NF135/5.C10]ETW49812.1 hypothetical protein PFMALIP_02170 [Plasmodium falciparum MaliPS096_E11]ETW52445.1 hypot|eukprot:XP_001349313.1 conserved Plasmodium protein, unknown function [Plasmodium falciparum 3D7]